MKKEEQVGRRARHRVRLSTTIPNLLAESFCSVTHTDPAPQVRERGLLCTFFVTYSLAKSSVPDPRIRTSDHGSGSCSFRL